MRHDGGVATALYPGSFDPLHNGHLAVIERSASSFDRVVVAVLTNPAKRGFLPATERLSALQSAIRHVDNAIAVSFDGLAVAAAEAHGADVLVRSWAKEYGSELAMATMNAAMSRLQTVFVPGRAETSVVSSTRIRALLRAGRTDDVRLLVPPAVFEVLAAVGFNGEAQ